MGRWGKKLGPETTKQSSNEKEVIQAESMTENEGTADKPRKNNKMQRQMKGVQRRMMKNSKKKKKDVEGKTPRKTLKYLKSTKLEVIL